MFSFFFSAYLIFQALAIGLLGYEGQPGNQGGPQHHSVTGLSGYEGQPGNQGGGSGGGLLGFEGQPGNQGGH